MPPDRYNRYTPSVRLDGSQDLLVSDEQSGCLSDMFWQDSKKFTFKHLLTQLNIRVRVEEGYPEGACLTRMQIGGSHPEVLLDLNKATLMAIGEPAVLTIWEPDGTGVLLSGSYTDTPTATVLHYYPVPSSGNIRAGTIGSRLQDNNGIVMEQLPFRSPGFPISHCMYPEKFRLQRLSSPRSTPILCHESRRDA